MMVFICLHDMFRWGFKKHSFWWTSKNGSPGLVGGQATWTATRFKNNLGPKKMWTIFFGEGWDSQFQWHVIPDDWSRQLFFFFFFPIRIRIGVVFLTGFDVPISVFIPKVSCSLLVSDFFFFCPLDCVSQCDTFFACDASTGLACLFLMLHALMICNLFICIHLLCISIWQHDGVFTFGTIPNDEYIYQSEHTTSWISIHTSCCSLDNLCAASTRGRTTSRNGPCGKASWMNVPGQSTVRGWVCLGCETDKTM